MNTNAKYRDDVAFATKDTGRAMDENTCAVVKCSVAVALTRRAVGRRVAASAAYSEIVKVTNVLADVETPR